MFDLLKFRSVQGRQYVRDLTTAQVNERFRGFPRLDEASCTECGACVEVCPTRAVTAKPLRLDLGSCLFCGACEEACETGAIHFTNETKLGASTREALIVSSGMRPADLRERFVPGSPETRRLFRRSLKLRSVSAGGCNACEMELAASTNVNFDIGRLGIDIVASPRHADGVAITGPVTAGMAFALEATFAAVPEPRIVIAFGTCAISGGLFVESGAIDRSFFDRHPVDIYVPGCPPHPLTFINAVSTFLGRAAR